jgi:hypothetical protein
MVYRPSLEDINDDVLVRSGLLPLLDMLQNLLGLLKVASATSTRLVTSEPAWLTK